jgi:hypothetical protein
MNEKLSGTLRRPDKKPGKRKGKHFRARIVRPAARDKGGLCHHDKGEAVMALSHPRALVGRVCNAEIAKIAEAAYSKSLSR